MFCVQETHLKSTHVNFLNQYVVFRKDRNGGNFSSGGVAIIAQRSVACQHIVLQSSLEVVAVRAILFNRLISICSIYIAPDEPFNKTEFEKLIDQLPEPYVLIGDFNAHSLLWGDTKCDARGRAIENFLLASGACLLNKAEPTYFSTTHNTYSCIDLAIGSPSLLPYLDWKVINNPYGSDHFPTLLATKQRDDRPSYPKKWNFHVANWVKFRELCTLRLEEVDHLEVEEMANYISEYVLVQKSAYRCPGMIRLTQSHGGIGSVKLLKNGKTKHGGFFLATQQQKT